MALLKVSHPSDDHFLYQYMTSSTYGNLQSGAQAYGRVDWVGLQNTTNSYYFKHYCYDGNGNVLYAAYAFQAANQNGRSCSGNGDSFSYDALGRVLTITHADSTKVEFRGPIA